MTGSFDRREPAVLSGASVVPPVVRFFLDPLGTSARLSESHGNFVHLRFPLSIGRMPESVVFTAAAAHFREVLGNPGVWRTVNILAAGRENHASSRLSKGLVRMRGKRHAHYRRLITPPLRRASVLAMGQSLGMSADEIADRWPTGETVDLLTLSRALVQELAIVHLFGNDKPRGLEIAAMINQYVAASWSLGINVLRLDFAGSAYRKFLRHTEALEAKILEWVATKRGAVDPHDLLSIIVNSSDETGGAASDKVIVGHVPTLFGATYETCQNALTWLLVLVGQHPKIEHSLRDEIAGALGKGPTTLEKVIDLPLLDAVVKEALRILPPVPVQYRVALEETGLSACPMHSGTRAALSAFTRNRDPEIFDNPDCFRPERWQSIDPTPFQYAVFSAGPRACPGFQFGTGLLKVATAAILTRYRIVFEERTEVDYKVSVALRPHPAVRCWLEAAGGTAATAPIGGKIRQLVRFPV